MKNRIKSYVDMVLSDDIETQKLAISLLKTDTELFKLLTPKENEELIIFLSRAFTEKNQGVSNLNLLLIAMKLNNISLRISLDLIKNH